VEHSRLRLEPTSCLGSGASPSPPGAGGEGEGVEGWVNGGVRRGNLGCFALPIRSQVFEVGSVQIGT